MKRESWGLFGGSSFQTAEPVWIHKTKTVTKTPIAAIGWVCPRCQAVHAPHVGRCDCPPPTETADTSQATT
jgi:hypothetical protein